MKPKLAHLFLIRDDLNHEQLWKRFFQGHETQYEIYARAKWPERVNSDWLRGKLISGHCDTVWGGISLVEAELLLLEAALQDEHNQFFLLHSESCVPLRSFEFAYQMLFELERSWVGLDRRSTYRYEFVDQSAISPEHFHKHSQFFCLNRSHAQFLLEKMDLRPWQRAECPDEHWIATLLSMHEKLDECLPRSLTFSRWEGNDKSPLTFHILSQEHLTMLRGTWNLFARKFAAESDIANYLPLNLPKPPA